MDDIYGMAIVKQRGTVRKMLHVSPPTKLNVAQAVVSVKCGRLARQSPRSRKLHAVYDNCENSTTEIGFD